MKKQFLKISLLLIICLFASNLFAQQQSESSLYLFQPLNYNPAYAGTRDALTASLIYRNQWVGIDGAPETIFLTAHSPIKGKNLSFGFTAAHDKIGITRTTSFFADAAYKVQLNDRRHYLSFGIKGGINVFDMLYTRLEAIEHEDLLNEDVNNQVKFNVGAGLYYYGERHFIGVSALNLLENSVLDTDDENIPGYRTIRHYYITGGYVFDLSTVVKVKPSVMIKMAEGAPIGPEAHLDFLLYDRLWIGGMYRHEKVAGVKILYNLTEQLRLGYAYDYVFNELTRYTGGSHELLLSYDFEFKDRKFKSPRYF